VKSNDPAIALERLEWLSWAATVVIFIGIIVEGWGNIHFWERPPSIGELITELTADGLIGFGLLVEALGIGCAIIWTRREKTESDAAVAAANARAADAALKASEAEARVTVANLRIQEGEARRLMLGVRLMGMFTSKLGTRTFSRSCRNSEARMQTLSVMAIRRKLTRFVFYSGLGSMARDRSPIGCKASRKSHIHLLEFR
jgi:hypothetical protein